MLYKLLALLAMIPGCFMMNWFMRKALPIKRPLLYAVLATGVACLLWLVNQMVLAEPTVLLELAVVPAGIGTLMFFTDQKLRGAIVCAVMHLAQVIGAVLCLYVCVGLMHVDVSESMMPGTVNFIYCSAVTSCVSILLEYGTMRLLQKLPAGTDLNARYTWFVSVPISQLVLLNLATRRVFDLNGYVGFTLAMVLCVVLCAAADGACILAYRKLRQLERLKIQVVQVEKSMDQQTAYYEQLQQQILAVNQIRHDLNNQLQAARYLLQKGDSKQVSEQLDILENSVRDRVGPRYCENLVADAVLSMKAEECRKQGVRLDASILLPLELPIRNAHLCSIFSNLLDNSIQGIRETGREGGTIRIRSDIQKNYLTVTCTNPAVEPRKQSSRDVLRQHGLGLEILEHLAKMYRGSMDTCYRDGSFTVTIFLSIA